MLRTKSCKIILFATALVMFLLAFVCLMPTNSKVVHAQADASTYFSKDGNSKMLLRNDGVELFEIVNNGYVELRNDVVLDTLAFDTVISTDISKATLTFKTDSFDVNASTVEHKLVMERGKELDFNGVKGMVIPADATELKIFFKVEDGNVSVSLGAPVNFVTSTDLEYKVLDIDKCIAKSIRFTFETDETLTDRTFKVNSIDQDYNDSEHKFLQTFKLDGNGEELESKAYSMISLHANNKLFVFDGENYVCSAERGKRYTLSFKAYSVVNNETTFGGVSKVNDTDPVSLANESIVDEVRFDAVGEIGLNVKIGSTTQEVKFNVVEAVGDTTAPTYFDNDSAIQSFVEKFADATIVKEGEIVYNIKLGEQVALPSMKTLVGDDFTAYENLKSTIYYSTPKESSSTSNWAITLDAPGKYFFYVVFEDASKNAMDLDAFKQIVESYQGEVTGSDDENRVSYYKVGSGADLKYFFTFEVKDDAPISVTAPKQTNGYVGSTYNASEFTIQYQSYTPTYELYYNSNTNASIADLTTGGWKKIDAVKNVVDADDVTGDFTFEEVKAIAYDGGLKFTPDRVGKYAIKCTVASTVSVRADYAVAEIVVLDEQEIVKPASRWLQENVWTVVFLGVGTLCLVGIILLIFVKPKKAQTKEEEVDE